MVSKTQGSRDRMSTLPPNACRSPVDSRKTLMRRLVGIEGDWVAVPGEARVEKIPKVGKLATIGAGDGGVVRHVLDTGVANTVPRYCAGLCQRVAFRGCVYQWAWRSWHQSPLGPGVHCQLGCSHAGPST